MRTGRRIAILLLVLAGACGGDDDDGGGDDAVGDDGGDGGDGGDGDGGDGDGGDGGDGADDGSGVDPSTALSELTGDEALALCEAIDAEITDALADLQTVTCYLGGILKAEDCASYVEQCLALEPSDPAPIDCELAAGPELPPCAADVTVGDIEDCFVGWVDLWGELASTITCESEYTEFNNALSEVPQACLDLFNACPDL